MIQKAKDLASLRHIRDRLLRLDEEINKLGGKLDEKERKIKRQLKVDLLKWSVEYLESHETTLIARDRDEYESQEAQKDHQQEDTEQ